MAEQARSGRLKRFLKGAVIYAAIIVITLGVIDLILIATGMFPPRWVPGHPTLGWVSAFPTGEMREYGCLEYSTDSSYRFMRNEDAMRTGISAAQLRSDTTGFRIAVGGDSQTDLCAPNERVHFGFLESDLRARGVPAVVFAYGAGKYSPLQAYLAVKPTLSAYHADAVVLNIYTGNDVYDMLRLDDRPYFVREGSGYRIAEPIWYQEHPPGRRYRSRVLFAIRTLAQRTGIKNVSVRLRYLRDVASEQGQGLGTVISYMNDLRRSATREVGYPAAFSAQMLNQQLFFHHFPGSREESLRRVRALLEMVRRDNPGLVLVLSALPSYQLVQQQPVDSALLHVIAQLPLTYEGGVREEQGLYDTLRAMASETGWTFVDNLTPLRAYAGSGRLYNNFDYHLLPNASAIVGRAQADAVAAAIGCVSEAGPARPAQRSRPRSGCPPT